MPLFLNRWMNLIWSYALRIVTLAFIATAVLLPVATVARAEEILASAAASLTDALSDIGRSYRQKSKNTVRFNFGPSSGLARQIEEGAPADLFFSADLAQMDNLEKKNLLEPGTRKNLLSNQDRKSTRL